MSLREFISLEAQALGVLKSKDPSMVWKAIECGAAEKMRLFAESRDYNVCLNDLTRILWEELCDRLTPEDWNV